MRKGQWLCVVAVMAMAASVQAEDITIHGEVIDPGLYLRDGTHGLEVEEQMYDAVDGGQSLAVLEDDTKTVYLCLAAQSGDDPNELLYEHIGRRVSVTGDLYQRGGIKGVVVRNVQSLDAPPVDAALDDAS